MKITKLTSILLIATGLGIVLPTSAAPRPDKAPHDGQRNQPHIGKPEPQNHHTPNQHKAKKPMKQGHKHGMEKARKPHPPRR